MPASTAVHVLMLTFTTDLMTRRVRVIWAVTAVVVVVVIVGVVVVVVVVVFVVVVKEEQ